MLGRDEGSKFIHRLWRHHVLLWGCSAKNSSDEGVSVDSWYKTAFPSIELIPHCPAHISNCCIGLAAGRCSLGESESLWRENNYPWRDALVIGQHWEDCWSGPGTAGGQAQHPGVPQSPWMPHWKVGHQSPLASGAVWGSLQTTWHLCRDPLAWYRTVWVFHFQLLALGVFDEGQCRKLWQSPIYGNVSLDVLVRGFAKVVEGSDQLGLTGKTRMKTMI